MKALIAIGSEKIGEGTIQTVNARDLYEFLEVKKDFSNWIKDRIKKYSFMENQDFVVFANPGENPTGGRPSIDYHLSLDMAKELSMVERNDKGKQARQYFLECERQALAPAPDPIQALNDPASLRKLLLTNVERVLALESKITEQAPKVAALDRLADADGQLCITDAAKVLQIRPKDLFAWLSANHWIYRRAGGKGWLGYQTKVQQGVLSHKITIIPLQDGTERVKEEVKVTAKGLAFLARALSTPSVPCPTKTIPCQISIN